MRTLKTLLLCSALLALAACSSTPKVNTDYNPKHNFGTIKSYHIVNKERSVNDLIVSRITSALDNSMTARGIKKVDAANADILIDFMVITKDKTRVTSYNTGYGYRGFATPYGGFGYGGINNVDVHQYTEGSLLIDLVDPSNKKTVWRGTSTATVKNRTPEEKTELANLHTETIVQKMPLGPSNAK